MREDTSKVSVLKRVFEEGSLRRPEGQNGDESREHAPKRIRTSYTRTGVLKRVFEEGSFRRAEAQNGKESRELTPKRIRTSYTRTGNKEVI